MAKTPLTVHPLSGWEFEMTAQTPAAAFEEVRNKIEIGHDGSVNGAGLEAKTRGPETPSACLDLLLKFLKSNSLETDTSCGTHYHFSLNENSIGREKTKIEGDRSSNFKRQITNNLFAIGSMYEKDLFDLMPRSRQNNRFCRKIAQTFQQVNPEHRTMRQKMGRLNAHKYSNDQRYCWLNFVELFRPGGIDTVEFRRNTSRRGSSSA